jgi:hypothetical protein
MGLRLLCVLAVCMAFAPDALAVEQPGVFRRASCSVVRYYVAKYSEAAAESWARSFEPRIIDTPKNAKAATGLRSVTAVAQTRVLGTQKAY